MESNITINGIKLKKFRPYIYERTDGYYFVVFCLTNCTLLYVYDKYSNWDGLKEEVVFDNDSIITNKFGKLKQTFRVSGESLLKYFVENLEDYRKMTFSEFLAPNLEKEF